jgi:alpha-ketoglutarate-dependent taurine dioxygenase
MRPVNLTGVRIQPLSAALGVEVLDVDARAPLDTATGDELRALYDRHHLLLLRGQQLSGPEQVQFVSQFGPLLRERSGEFGYVSNVRPDGIVREGALLFHSDFAFAREPIHGLSLHAVDVPDDGSPTLFADAVRAVAALPPALHALLASARVANQFDFGRPSDRRYHRDELAPGSPITEHPAIGTHPRTGEPVLFVNEMHSERLVGLDSADSDTALAATFAVLYAEGNVYEHRWRAGDLVVWDNIAVHHGRRSVPLDAPRTLQRVALGRYTADELVPNLDELLGRR